MTVKNIGTPNMNLLVDKGIKAIESDKQKTISVKVNPKISVIKNNPKRYIKLIN